MRKPRSCVPKMPRTQPWWVSSHARDPCGHDARLSASGRHKQDMPPPWAVAAWPSFAPLKVGKGDWLAKGEAGEKDRSGQTLAQFLRPGPHRHYPAKHKKTIYLVPIGDVAGAPPFEFLAACVGANFGLPVKLGKKIGKTELAQIRVCEEGAGYGVQLEAPDITRVLAATRKERDAFVVVGYTMYDLCSSDAGFNFLFGQANRSEERV